MSRAKSHGHAPATHAGHDEHDHPGLTIRVETFEEKATVHLTLTAAEIERARNQEYRTLSQRVTLKGFRPGKTPRAMLEKHFEREVEPRLVEHFLKHAYQMAVDQEKLRPAAYPRVDLGTNVPGKGTDWSASFDVLLRPVITLGEIENMPVEAPPVEVVDGEIDRALIEIRRANSRAEPDEGGELAPEGMAVATLDFFRPGSSEACLQREGIRLSPKTPPQDVDKELFEQTLVGARSGDQRALEMTFPANFPLEEARGEQGSVRFTFQQILKIVPPSDEEVFKAFEASDEASLRESVRARMLVAKQEAEDQRIETELLERVISNHVIKLPGQLVDDQIAAHQEQLVRQLVEQGASEEDAKKQAEGELENSRAQAEKALKAIYLVEAIAQKKELRVTPEDVTGEMKAIAERNGTDPAEVAKYYRDEGLLRQLGLELLERKVRRYLRTSAKTQTAS
ncbi:MAG: trigger factor [Planctomycetota bacterium]